MAENNQNYFEKLNSVDVSSMIEQKNGLSYLAWAYAWAEVKKRYPQAFYTIYENADGWNYFTDGRTCWVKTGVTVDGLEHIEDLPVMDNRNKSIPLLDVTSCDVNKAIQRSLTKAIARHGLGLYVYAGEDLPESIQNELDTYVKAIVALGTELMSNGVPKDTITTIVSKYNNGNGNPNTLASVDAAKAIVDELNKCKAKEKKQ